MAEPFVGEIKLFGFGFAPRNYVACDGRLLPINQYQALFSLLGTQYGGNGVQTFGVPDLRGRTPLHFAPATISIGLREGVEAVPLTQGQIPPHTHQLSGTNQTATQRPVTGGAFANDVSLPVDFFAPASTTPPAAKVVLAPQTLSSSGGSQPHNNMQPFQVLNLCIAVQGIFPSRN
ncbi:phage tail protein [Sphingomonas sp. Leaf4]|uniref:phage tail protein n=1 Tax=Sphingomonas sp. Leaf4 TaxID=2876553 RepID=UPI001E2E2E03|nr:tail fiber protein [Sphingomonas sp. Leaf4]